MRYGSCAIFCLAAISPFAFAQTFDRAKLRQAIEMPVLTTSFGVNFKSNERDAKGNKFDPLQKIAELQKKLTGTSADAEILLEQRAVYVECLKDEKKAKELAEKVEALLRPHLQTNDPKQAYLLTVYGSVLEVLMDNPWNDCEKLGRRAVTLSPQDWRCWAYLGHAKHQQIPAILCGGDDKELPKEQRTQQIIGRLYLQRFRPEHVDAAEKVLNEALQYHDKAKELAPNEPQRQVQRYGFRLAEIVMRNAVSVYRSQKTAYPMLQIERVLLDELQDTARLHPDHLLWQSQLTHQLVLLGWQTNRNNDGKPAKTFRPARPEDERAIREALGRIEKLAEQAKGDTAVYCYGMLGALCAAMQELTAVEKHARKILQLEPNNQMAGEQLQQTLLLQKRHADQLQAAQTLAQTNKTARNYFMLAKALVLNQGDDLAEQECLNGLKKNPTDAHCLLGTAALLMRRADDAKTLQTVRDLLDKAGAACRNESNATVLTDLEYLSAIHQALSNETAIARIRLQRLQLDDAANQRYEKALAALGQ